MPDQPADEERTEQLLGRLTKRGYPLPVIDGYQLSYHAAVRMVARRIEIDWVADALNKPSRPSTHAEQTRKHVGDMAMVVINPHDKVILTVGYGELNNEH